MSPQLSANQLAHAAKNAEKLIAAKKLEIHAYSKFQKHAPAAIRELLDPLSPKLQRFPGETAGTVSRDLQDATENLFTAKLNHALIELEELELQLKAVRHIQQQQGSMIQVPSSGVKLG